MSEPRCNPAETTLRCVLVGLGAIVLLPIAVPVGLVYGVMWLVGRSAQSVLPRDSVLVTRMAHSHGDEFDEMEMI